LLDTSDTQDRVIIDDTSPLVLPTRIIAAWGNSSEPTYHGRNAVRGTMRFYGSSDMISEEAYFVQVMESEAQGNFTIGASNYTIPSDVVTTYQLFCYSRDDLLSMGVPINEDLHAIGFETLVQPGNEKFIHHIIAYASPNPWNSSLPCTNEGFNVLENSYGWATGDVPLALPPNVGGPLGSKGYQSYALEIHYDNAEMTANVSDNTVVKIYYTNVKREHDLGIFQVGDPIIGLRETLVNPQGGLTQHSFTCGSQCLQEYLTQPVTVIKEHLHMHKTGVNMVNYHVRNDQVIRQGRVDFWDFNQQGHLGVVQAPYQMNPGDSFHTVCNYETSNTAKWGLAAEEEMCVAFLYYYPRQASSENYPIMCGIGTQWFLPGCFVEHETTPDFTTVEQLERVFGSAPDTCQDKTSTKNQNEVGSTSSSPKMAPSKTFTNCLVYAVLVVVFLSTYV
jgi:dopamine beta-monooxygenase